VRWATVDPNPLAQKREARKIEEQAADAIRRALPAEYVAEIEGRGEGWEEAKKRRKIEGSFGLEGYQAGDDVWYASEKARLDGADGGEDQGGPLLIEDVKTVDHHTTGGILPESTMRAMKGYTAGSNGGARIAPDKKTGGPLVGYGSDDEDSD